MEPKEFSKLVKELQSCMKEDNKKIENYENEFEQSVDPIEQTRLKTLIIDSKLNTIMGNISLLIKYIIELNM